MALQKFLPRQTKFGIERNKVGLVNKWMFKSDQMLLVLDPEIGQWKLLFDYNFGGKMLIEPFINDELKSTFKL